MYIILNQNKETIAYIQNMMILDIQQEKVMGILIGDCFFGRNKKVVSTGFPNLDNHLDGGVHEGLYVIGAISSLGKTTFMIQIADYISSQGQDVLYISLEMSKYEIMAKSISRHTLLLFDGQESNLAKTTRGITVGSNYDHYIDLEIDAINEAIKEYKNQSKNLWIIHYPAYL